MIEKLPNWAWNTVAAIVIILIVMALGTTSFRKRLSEVKIQPTKIQLWSKSNEIVVSPDHWSESYQTPSGNFKITPALGDKVEVLFSDNKYYLLDSYEQMDLGRTSGSFRLRGVDREVTVYIYTSS